MEKEIEGGNKTKPKKRNGALIAVIVIITLITLAGGIFYFTRQRKPQQVQINVDQSPF